MDIGILIPPVADSWKVVKRAEELGYSRAWFFDTPMVSTELFVSMTAAAMATDRIRIGSGVMVADSRSAPVVASALASLNALAPGRIDWGVGTGFSARRALGMGPVTLSAVEELVQVVTGLLAGNTVDWHAEGADRTIAFLNPELGAIDIESPIPVHISAFGPRSRRLTARLGAGWMNATPSLEASLQAMADMRSVWSDAGRDDQDLFATSCLSASILRPGESYDSPRVIEQAGPLAAVALHNAVELDQFGDLRRPLPPELKSLMARYREIYLDYSPAHARHLRNHAGHLMRLRPEEHEVVTGDLIRVSTATGTPEELRDRIRAQRDAGYQHFAFNVGYRGSQSLEEWLEIFEAV